MKKVLILLIMTLTAYSCFALNIRSVGSFTCESGERNSTPITLQVCIDENDQITFNYRNEILKVSKEQVNSLIQALNNFTTTSKQTSDLNTHYYEQFFSTSEIVASGEYDAKIHYFNINFSNIFLNAPSFTSLKLTPDQVKDFTSILNNIDSVGSQLKSDLSKYKR